MSAEPVFSFTRTQLADFLTGFSSQTGPTFQGGPALASLFEQWKAQHARLNSFACDAARAGRLLEFVPEDGPHAGVALGTCDSMTLSPVDVDLWRSFRYRQTTRLRRSPAAATINREVMMLLRILNFAVSRRAIPHNPLEGAGILEAEDNTREVIVDEAGFDAIIRRLRLQPVVAAFVTLAFDSGMRITEVHLCRWSWFDRDRGYVTIPGSVAKNGMQRVADLIDRAMAALKRLPRIDDRIFINPTTGHLYEQRHLYGLYRQAVISSGIRGPSGEMPVFHDLRRSWVTLARRRGIPESEIMAKSGHQDHSVFRRYSIVGDEDLRRSRDRMESARAREVAQLARRRRTVVQTVAGRR